MSTSYRFGPRLAAKSLSCAVMAVIAGAVAFPAQAQVEETTGDVLDVITVTAQKREQNLQDVSGSVAALRGETLDVLSSAGADIRFLSARVPSLMIESSFGRTFPRFYIRGLGNTDFDLNASQPVSLVYDEVVLENPILKGFPVFDLERIEVLRGPQGTLFGRNTPAGIVKFESKKPSDEFDAYASMAYGRFNAVDFESAIGGPLPAKGLSARISTMYQRRDDWIDNLAPGNEEENALGGFSEFAGRFQLLFEPTENFSALFNVHGRLLDGTARVFRANVIQPGTNELISSFARDEVFHDGDNFQDVDAFGASANLNYDFGATTLTSVTGYESATLFSRGDIDGGFGDFFNPPSGPYVTIPFSSETADAIPALDQFTQEIRLTSNAPAWDRVNYLLGFFYFHEDLEIESFSFNTPGGGFQDGYAVQAQEAKSWAIFGSTDIILTDRFNLEAGLRYTSDEKEFSAELVQSPIFFLGATPFSPDPVNPSDEVLSWDAALKFAATEDVNLYARVAKGFRAPSIQGRLLFYNNSVDSEADAISIADTETIMSYEAGVKSTLLDGRARVNLSGFYFEMDDQQLTAVGGAANFNRLINAENTEGFGFEFEMEMVPVENLLFTAGVSYNSTEIQDDDLTIVPCGGGCTVLDPGVGTVSIDGNVLPHAPKWIANWTLRYGMPIGGHGELFVFTDWAYRSKVQFFLYESVEFSDDVLLEGGLRAGYVTNDGKYELAAFGRNITNDTSRTGGIDFNNLTGFVNEPTVWGVEFTARLN